MDNLGRPPPAPTTVTGMGERRAVTVAAVLWCTAATVVLVGCTPEAAPTPLPLPTATGFASDEEAFAAAEATYRAYVDALNDVDLADPSTFEPVRGWLTGEALSESDRSLSGLRAQQLRVVGETAIHRIAPQLVYRDGVTIQACLDVTAVDLLDSDGESVVAHDRPDRQPLEVRLVIASTPTGLQISHSESVASEVCH